jgi:hypothetical protein
MSTTDQPPMPPMGGENDLPDEMSAVRNPPPAGLSDDDGDDGDFTEMPNGGLPVEAETPPEPRPATGKKRGKAATAG